MYRWRYMLMAATMLVAAFLTAVPSMAQRPSRSQANEDGEDRGARAAKSIDAEDATGGLRYTIQVVKFEDESGWAPHNASWRLTTAWSEMLTAKLAEDGRFTVVAERDMREEARKEQNFAESSWSQEGSSKAPQKGHMTPAQLIVKGTITGAKASSGGSSGGIQIPGTGRSVRIGSEHSSVMIVVQVIDAQTATVLAAKEVEGKAGKKSLNFNNLLPQIPYLSKYGDEPMVKACYDALGKAIDTCAEALPKIQWRGSIVDIDGGEVYLNRGNREGVKAGHKFSFGTGKELTDPDTGESLGYRFTEVGQLEIVEVEEKISRGRVLAGGKPAASMLVWLPKK